MNNEFMGFATDEATAAVLREWAERQGFSADSIMMGGADLLISLLESEPAPKMVVVDMDNLEQPVHTASRLVSVCGQNCKVIALDSTNDVSLFRNMMATGLADYLIKPLTVDALTQSVTTINRTNHNAAQGIKETKVVVVLGSRGGIGASTVAINSAWITAEEMKRKTILIDLDLQFGVAALALNLEAGRGLRDVVSSPQRVDSLMLAGAMASTGTNLSVISAEEALDDLIHVDTAAISALIKELKPNYNAIFVDLPRHLLPTQRRLLAIANEIIIVTELSLVGIRNTQNILTLVKGLSGTARITLVAPRSTPQRPDSLDEATFTKSTKTKIDFYLPDDAKNLIAASNNGDALSKVAPNAPLTKTLRDLTTHILSNADTQSPTKKGGKKSFFSALFGSDDDEQKNAGDKKA